MEARRRHALASVGPARTVHALARETDNARNVDTLVHVRYGAGETPDGADTLVGVESGGITYLCGTGQVAVIDAKGQCRRYTLDASANEATTPTESLWVQAKGGGTWRNGVISGLDEASVKVSRRGNILFSADISASKIQNQATLAAADATLRGRPARLGPIFDAPLKGVKPAVGGRMPIFGTYGSNTEWTFLSGHIEAVQPDGIVSVMASGRKVWTRVGLVHEGGVGGLAAGDAVHVVSESETRRGRYVGPADGGKHRVRLENMMGAIKEEVVEAAVILPMRDGGITVGTRVRWQRSGRSGEVAWSNGTVAAIEGEHAWILRSVGVMAKEPLAQLRVIAMKPMAVGERVVMCAGPHADDSGARPGKVTKVRDPLGLGYRVVFDDAPDVEYPALLGDIDRP